MPSPPPTHTLPRSLLTTLLPLLSKPPTFPTTTIPSHRARAPNPTIFSLPPSPSPDDAVPDISEAALHLLLLEVFWSLFRWVDAGEEELGEGKVEEVRRRWLCAAVERFEVWWEGVAREVEMEGELERMQEGVGGGENTGGDMLGDKENGGGKRRRRKLKPEQQPPLDVLLVWHTYLLTPGVYWEDCVRLFGEGMLEVEFPWDMIKDSIDQDTLTYHLPTPAAAYFTTLTTFPADRPTASSSPSMPHPHALHGCTCPTSSSSPSPTSTPPPSRPSTPPSTPSLCLPSAILRQYTFITKMHHLLFLRSPTLPSTLHRATTRYTRFIDLFRLHPGETMVPTLDIDLIWHTHQLSPMRYRVFCECPNRAARWVKHEDTFGADVLGERVEVTERRYGELCGERYRGCLCWRCELERCGSGWEKVSGGGDTGESEVRDAEDEGSTGEQQKERKKEKENGKELKWWNVSEKKTDWEKRVVVEFWRQVERRRWEGDEVGLHKGSLGAVLGDGFKDGGVCRCWGRGLGAQGCKCWRWWGGREREGV
ncbi:hypothetical protein EX30DRAFT_393099 [Ascodesmis nigricans]|uniref:Uncharacterized protein n=1 Tax=Ascodesmis nigricans TaxID=341454 RepID=A0A4S2N345_9PEZI|nr:hypothetical protein EX30DRAFT_393099 [Ascodesmis nigricans]